MKRIKLFLSALLGAASIALAAAGVTFAWLSGATTSVDVDSAHGGIISQYFHCGSGTQNDPYVITRPIHLYNLTMLYENLDGFAAADHHFRLGYDLDGDGDLEFYSYSDAGVHLDGYSDSLNMGYYDAFVPIGSESKPFGGVFDGSNLTIDNLSVSGNGASEIGVFGYVSDTAEIKDLYIDNLSVDVTGAVADSQGANAYVGYIAGHIDDATCFENTYVNNCEITGHSVLTKNDWGYFGRCDNAATIAQFIAEASGEGQGDDWGGSIDARSYNKWIYDLYKTSVASSGTVWEKSTMQFGADTSLAFNTKNYTDFTLQFATNYKTDVYGKNGNYTSYDYYMNPDNFNEPEDGKSVRNTSGIYSTVYQFKDNNYIPLRFADDARTAVDSNNPGYIVGSSYGTARLITASPKLASYYYSSIGNSLQDTAWVVNSALTNKTLEYTDSKLEVLTYKNGWYRIEDSHNYNNTTTNSLMTQYVKKPVSELSFNKYNEARNHIQTVSESTDRMHGIHFENNEVSISNKITKNNGIKIHGETYNDLLRGSVEFHLKKNGFINFFAGTYYTATRNFNFFSIYKVDRTNGTISSVKRIAQIYLNTAAGPKYVYKYSDNTYSEGTAGQLVFDVASTLEADAPVNNALYYFEIPVNDGEYAMGMVPGKSASSYTGAYMIYLDLSASGSTPGTTDVDDFESIEYRSNPDTSDSSILLITYSQGQNEDLTISVVYDDLRKRYDITCQGDHVKVTVTILSVDYDVYFNSEQLPSAIGSVHRYPS